MATIPTDRAVVEMRRALAALGEEERREAGAR
jgi:hypothetical protein